MSDRPIWNEVQVLSVDELWEDLEVMVHRGDEERLAVLTCDPYEFQDGDWRIELDYLDSEDTDTLHLSDFAVIQKLDGTWDEENWLEDITR